MVYLSRSLQEQHESFFLVCDYAYVVIFLEIASFLPGKTEENHGMKISDLCVFLNLKQKFYVMEVQESGQQ